jgi:hypothetical protein
MFAGLLSVPFLCYLAAFTPFRCPASGTSRTIRAISLLLLTHMLPVHPGDWLVTLSWCLLCGWNSPIPYFQAIYFLILLIHR